MRALWPYAVSVAVIAGVVWPVTWSAGHDSFPLSPYPMFSRKRDHSEVKLHYVIGTSGQRRVALPPHLVANSEPMLAKATVRRAVRAGRRRTRDLCAEVADRVARASDYAWVDTVSVMTGVFDARGYILGDTEPVRERRRARCAVARGPG